MLRLTEATESTFAQFSKNVVVTVADMGFLKVRTVKGHDYPMWCKRVRSRKRSGGDGGVKSVEISLGRDYDYLAWYLATGDVDLLEFAGCFVQQALKSQAEANPMFSPDAWQVNLAANGDRIKVKLRGLSVDARGEIGRYVRSQIVRWLEPVTAEAHWFDTAKVKLGTAWQDYRQALVALEHSRQRLKRYLADPHAILETRIEDRYNPSCNKWQSVRVNIVWPDDAQSKLETVISFCEAATVRALQRYEVCLADIGDRIPPKLREDFINSLEHRVRGKA